MLARALLNQDRLDDILAEDALIPHKESHAKVVFLPEALLDELSFVLPTAEVSAKRPQRKVCHRLRKLVRSLNGRERKAIRFGPLDTVSHDPHHGWHVARRKARVHRSHDLFVGSHQ